jgi:hypothetical protein
LVAEDQAARWKRNGGYLIAPGRAAIKSSVGSVKSIV